MNMFGLSTRRMHTMMAIVNYTNHCIINKIRQWSTVFVDGIETIPDPSIKFDTQNLDITTSHEITIIAETVGGITFSLTFNTKEKKVDIRFIQLLKPIGKLDIVPRKDVEVFREYMRVNLTKLFERMLDHENDLKFTVYDAQTTTKEIIDMLSIKTITADEFISSTQDLDDINYSHVLYHIDDPNSWGADGALKVTKIKKHLEKDLMISHMYNWDILLNHIPAFYVENGDLQYIEWWDPFIMHYYFSSGDIKQVIKIV